MDSLSRFEFRPYRMSNYMPIFDRAGLNISLCLKQDSIVDDEN